VPGVGAGQDDGCVRLSLVHYNTPAEVERCIAALEALDL
jgi:selenocysteine lyase/cysteine desulfurase